MLPTIEYDLTGVVNRRDSSDTLTKGQVLSRENLVVMGVGEQKTNKKMMGSDRVNPTDIGGVFLSGYRYYNGNTAITFLYHTDKAGNGTLYHMDNFGNLTNKITLPHIHYPQPCWEEIKVSGANILYFSDGYNGLYSYDGNFDFEWTKTPVELNFVQMVSFLDRLWGFEEDSDTVYFSVNGDPTNFTDTSDAGAFLVGSKRGAKLQSLAIYLETIFFFKNDSIFVLGGRAPSEFSLREAHPSLGVAARRSVVQVESSIMFLGSDFEFHSFGGTQSSTKFISYNMGISGDFSKDLLPILNKYRMDEVQATYHNFLYRCTLVENGGVLNNLEYIYNSVNETDGLTRGNNVSCYMIYDKLPDIGQLFTGRSDAGFLMAQYRGLNWDNQATTPTMPIKLQSGFMRVKEVDNYRIRHIWGDFDVLGAEDLTIDHYIDCRIAASDKQTVQLAITGEYKSPTNFIRIASQSAVTSRAILPWGRSKGLSHSFGFDVNRNNLDLSVSRFYADAIIKNRKRSVKVGI